MPAMASVTTKLKRKGGGPDMEQSLVNGIVWGQTFTINQEGGSICDIR
jgi:hypothetical protein